MIRRSSREIAKAQGLKSFDDAAAQSRSALAGFGSKRSRCLGIASTNYVNIGSSMGCVKNTKSAKVLLCPA
jgi:hypothetical protein